jgi:ubiquinone/menaquinone biosynthesis C-methylase UbiE
MNNLLRKLLSNIKRYNKYYVSYSRNPFWPHTLRIRKDQLDVAVRNISRYIQSGHFLDVGTGPAFLPIELAKYLPNIKVTGIDIEQTLLDDGEINIKKSGFDIRITLIKASAESLPFADNAFDLVISTMSFHQWQDKHKGLVEIRRVLKPGMQVIVLVGKTYLVGVIDGLLDIFTRKTEKIMCNYLTSAGFKNISFIDDLSGVVYVIGFK